MRATLKSPVIAAGLAVAMSTSAAAQDQNPGGFSGSVELNLGTESLGSDLKYFDPKREARAVLNWDHPGMLWSSTQLTGSLDTKNVENNPFFADWNHTGLQIHEMNIRLRGFDIGSGSVDLWAGKPMDFQVGGSYSLQHNFFGWTPTTYKDESAYTMGMVNNGLFGGGIAYNYEGKRIEFDLLTRAPGELHEIFIQNVSPREGLIADNDKPSLRFSFTKKVQLNPATKASYGLTGRYMQPGQIDARDVTEANSSVDVFALLAHDTPSGITLKGFFQVAYITNANGIAVQTGVYTSVTGLARVPLFMRDTFQVWLKTAVNAQEMPYRDSVFGDRNVGGEAGLEICLYCTEKFQLQAAGSVGPYHVWGGARSGWHVAPQVLGTLVYTF